MSRTWIIALSVVGGIVLILVAVALVIPDTARLVSEGDTQTLTLGPISVLVADPEPAAESPDQYLGVRGPPPAFDTASLGADLNLQHGKPNFAALESEDRIPPDRIIRAVYLGDDSEHVPVYIYSEGSTTNPIEMIMRLIFGEGGVFRFGSTYSCCLNGPLWEEAYGERVLSFATSEGETVVTAEWHGLPSDVSVVALEIEGQPVGWQTPTSGTAAFRVEASDIDDVRTATVTLIAYDAQGQEQART